MRKKDIELPSYIGKFGEAMRTVGTGDQNSLERAG